MTDPKPPIGLADPRQIEQALTGSEERFRQMMRQAPLSIQILSPEGMTLEVNSAWEKLWGIEFEALHDYNILQDAQLEERGILPFIRRAYAGEACEIPPIGYVPDRGIYEGQARWVRAFIYPVMVDGEVVQVVLVHEDISERKEAEEALSASERRHRAIFENTQDAILLADDEGRFQDANPAASALTGYSREELLQLSVKDITAPEIKDQYSNHWDTFVNQGSLDGRYIVLRKDGSLATTEYRAIANVLPGLHASILRDISQRVEAEKALRVSEERFRELADSMPAIVWTSTPEGDTDFLNRGYYDYTGLSRSIPGLEGWHLVVHPDDREPAQENYHDCFVQGRTWVQELRLKRHDGAFRWHLSRSVPVRGADGKVVRWFATSTDIHDQKMAEDKAREEARALETINRVGQTLSSELVLENLVQSLTDAGTELCGAQFGAFFYNVTNQAGESYTLYTISGVPRSEFERFPMPRNTHIFEPTFLGTGIVRSDNITKDPRYGKMAPHYGMPKGHLPVRSYLALPVISRSGEVIGGLFFGHAEEGVFSARHEQMLSGIASQAAIAIDNARLYQRLSSMNAELEKRVKERTAELEAANREMEGFTYSVSHDLRGPLRAIMSTSMILKEDYGPLIPEEAREQLASQAKAAKKMGDLIDDLLRLSRLARQELSRADVDLTDLATELFEESKARDRCPNLCFEVQPGLHARVDPKLFRLALSNLIENACKFSPNGGTITFGKEDDVFFVRDQGIGFDPKYAHKMFLPFERLVLDSEFPGTGIGLANVKRILDRHLGKVWAEGELGKGATFYFTLPD